MSKTLPAGSEQSTAVASCPRREQTGCPTVPLSPAEQAGLAQGLPMVHNLAFIYKH